MTLLLMMVSLKLTLKQDLATADEFTRNPRGLRGGCAWWGRQETSVRQENCGAVVGCLANFPCCLIYPSPRKILQHKPQQRGGREGCLPSLACSQS